MAHSSQIEPKLLSIEAIIQKSEYSSKLLNNMPVDFKKLFMEQIAKPSLKSKPLSKEALAYINYSKTLEHPDPGHPRKSNNFVASRPVKAKSAYSAGRNHVILDTLQVMQTTRVRFSSVEGKRNERPQRNSMADMRYPHRPLGHNNEENSNNMNFMHSQDCSPRGQFLADPKPQRVTRAQYQLILPEKESWSNGLRKVCSLKEKVTLEQKGENCESNNEGANSQEIDSNQFVKTQERFSTEEKQTSQQAMRPACSKKSKKQSQIPQFLLAALDQERKKVSPIKQVRLEATDLFEDLSEKQTQRWKSKISTNVVNMKKKTSFYRARRSQESCAVEVVQAMEPKANLIRLVEKQKMAVRRKAEAVSKEKPIGRERVPMFRAVNKKIRMEEEVKGWEYPLGESRQFQYQY